MALEMDGRVFLSGTFAFFVEDCKLSVGVAKRLCLISADIKFGTIRSPLKRARSSQDEGDHSPRKRASPASNSQEPLVEKASKLDGAAVQELDGRRHSSTPIIHSV